MVQYFLRNNRRLMFLVKYFIQRPFIENVAALIKSWSFLEGISSPSAEKKIGEAETGALYASRSDIS